MASAEIYITFDDNDDLVLEVKGARGKACKDLTRQLEKALGTVKETKLKPEYRQAETKNVARTSAKR